MCIPQSSAAVATGVQSVTITVNRPGYLLEGMTAVRAADIKGGFFGFERLGRTQSKGMRYDLFQVESVPFHILGSVGAKHRRLYLTVRICIYKRVVFDDVHYLRSCFCMISMPRLWLQMSIQPRYPGGEENAPLLSHGHENGVSEKNG